MRQEDQGQEAVFPRGYARAPDVGARPFRQHSGSSRQRPADDGPAQPVSMPVQALCRRRPTGWEFPTAVMRIMARIDVDIVKRSERAKGFVVLPERWRVERAVEGLNRCRRQWNAWKRLNRRALALLRLASIRLMLRKRCIHE